MNSEKEMREHEVPWPKSKEELLSYFDVLIEAYNAENPQTEDPTGEAYGKAVYVMSCMATAAFYYASHIVGASGFQASCADMNFLTRTRSMKYGFRIIDYNDLLYPQNKENVPSWSELIEKNIEWLSKEAKKLLGANPDAHPNVLAHWEMLVERA